GVSDDLGHELARVEAAARDLAELRLPLAGQLRALQAPVLHDRHQVAAQVGRGQRLLLPRDVAAIRQCLDSRLTLRRCVQPPPLARNGTSLETPVTVVTSLTQTG